MKKLKALESENVKCENCGKVIKDKIITLCSLSKETEISLCVNCFLGISAQKVNYLEQKR
jgi:recombinational DNA repair protein RecR